jgi:hypothetical protein
MPPPAFCAVQLRMEFDVPSMISSLDAQKIAPPMFRASHSRKVQSEIVVVTAFSLKMLMAPPSFPLASMKVQLVMVL